MRENRIKYTIRAVAIMLLSTVISSMFNSLGIGKENTLMVFIVGVLVVAYFTNGYQYGIMASVIGVLAFNYLFTEPLHSFAMTEKNDVILMAFFLIASLISSNLTVRFQKQVKVAQENEQLARKLSIEQERIKFAMEKEQMKSNMLRSISHDLRTPLTGIAGASSLISASEGKMDQKSIIRLATDINEQAEWLIRLVENILSMTKIDSGKLMIEKSPEVVDDVVNDAVAHVVGIRDNRKLIIHIPEEVVLVPMDGKMIVQVLINLLDNAVKHTSLHGIISVDVRKEADKVWFHIKDNGTGIEESIMDKVFDDFVTFRKVSSDAGKGIGLGLTICKAIIHAHGGEIYAENNAKNNAENGAENNPEQGAEFRFYLPLTDNHKV